MRFASLSLERYGLFADCELTFRSGNPDLHVVYGANEAGKTTSLAAVSDLLFGFPPRSPYNFVYDYSLMRVGAVLEENGESFGCRRKKGTSNTLIDAADRPINEGPLLAMLKGQTRETFGLTFSLNQIGLRAGGKAMVDARDDAGRALFAAGSGLTGVSDELARLEAEADAIWGPRASQRRSFTLAERHLTDQTRTIRDQMLKPKTWLDARAALTAAEGALADTQARRDEVMSEVSKTERIRRVAPFARLRAQHLAALADHDFAVEIRPQREFAAETAMAEIEAATRAKSAAEQLVREAEKQIDAVAPDAAILGLAPQIDELVTSSGAIEKGRRDWVRLSTEKEVATANVARLQEDAGSLAAVPPTRVVSSKLRTLAIAHAKDCSALEEIAESEAELTRRSAALSAKTAPDQQRPELASLTSAIEAARALGADVDARCVSTREQADKIATSLNHALARLAPWSGDVDTLLSVPRIAQDEIDDTRSALATLATQIAEDEQTAVRSREDAAAIVLEMQQLASGAAVSQEDIAAARTARTDRWLPLREHVLSNTPLPSPQDAVTVFEAAMGHADERSDLRFAAADESGRLAILDDRRATLLLQAQQADERAEPARARAQATRAAWRERLTSVGYPQLEPVQLPAWMSDRDAAERAHGDAREAKSKAEAARNARDTARAALAASLAQEPGAPSGVDLAPLLAFADGVRKAGEKSEEEGRLNKAALSQLEKDAEALRHRRGRIEDAMAARADEWSDLVTTFGLELDIAAATPTLDILDELRNAMGSQAELQARLDGISRDIREYEQRVQQTGEVLDLPNADDASKQLDILRTRLTNARAAAEVLTTLKKSRAKRNDEVAAADAKIVAANASLKPLMDETGSGDLVALSAAIARSRLIRGLREQIAAAEAEMLSHGDGYGLDELTAALEGVDFDSLAARTETLTAELAGLNAEVAGAATARGDARRAFATLEEGGGAAVDAASAAEHARAELAELAEHYILKRAETITLRWAIEQYRERHQGPMLVRASALFSTLTLGRYSALRIDSDGPTPRLLGLRDDGRTAVEVGVMSEGTTDQLFLALKLAAVEQSIAAGVRLPFLADDLFVNFDDDRSEAGFRVLSELAQSTQVLFFTHHPHLAAIARSVVGADLHSECALGSLS